MVNVNFVRFMYLSSNSWNLQFEGETSQKFIRQFRTVPKWKLLMHGTHVISSLTVGRVGSNELIIKGTHIHLR